jgi:hypothetical protein
MRRDETSIRGHIPLCAPLLTPHPRREAIARRDSGDETLTDIARTYNVSHLTISRL